MAYIRSGLFIVSVAFAFAASSRKLENPEERNTVALITEWEHEAAAADLAGDVSFYQKGLADDWSDGMSNGEFQTKAELISDFTDKAKYTTLSETLSDIKVRVYGNTAIATYTEKYDALLNGRRRSRTIITTDTFVKLGDEWKHVAAHSSAVSRWPL
ncbi:MAG: nuclear transport factor 2 family protein [Bryobacteraceae bacterium]